MKNYFKLVVVVFGVTLASFSSMKSHALLDANAVRCVAPYVGGCVKVQHVDGTSSWLTGTAVRS